MRNLLFAAVAACVLGTSYSASAVTDADRCLAKSTCTSAVTTDSGSTGKACKDTSTTECLCNSSNFSCPVAMTASGGACSSGWTSVGLTVTGYRCCINTLSCWLANGNDAESINEEIVSSRGNSIGNVFQPDVTEIHFGYVNSVNRSPNLGRGNSRLAKLDVCLGATDTDTALSAQSVSVCQSYCGTTNYNDYCTANGAAVCYDRCECALSDPNCNNL